MVGAVHVVVAVKVSLSPLANVSLDVHGGLDAVQVEGVDHNLMLEELPRLVARDARRIQRPNYEGVQFLLMQRNWSMGQPLTEERPQWREVALVHYTWSARTVTSLPSLSNR